VRDWQGQGLRPRLEGPGSNRFGLFPCLTSDDCACREKKVFQVVCVHVRLELVAASGSLLIEAGGVLSQRQQGRSSVLERLELWGLVVGSVKRTRAGRVGFPSDARCRAWEASTINASEMSVGVTISGVRIVGMGRVECRGSSESQRSVVGETFP
jgi:hypothetical protein